MFVAIRHFGEADQVRHIVAGRGTSAFGPGGARSVSLQFELLCAGSDFECCLFCSFSKAVVDGSSIHPICSIGQGVRMAGNTKRRTESEHFNFHEIVLEPISTYQF